MIAWLVVATFGTALFIGWYGYKAVMRIQAWGVNMNERDHMLAITEPEEAAEFMVGYRNADAQPRSDPTPTPNPLSLWPTLLK